MPRSAAQTNRGAAPRPSLAACRVPSPSVRAIPQGGLSQYVPGLAVPFPGSLPEATHVNAPRVSSLPGFHPYRTAVPFAARDSRWHRQPTHPLQTGGAAPRRLPGSPRSPGGVRGRPRLPCGPLPRQRRPSRQRVTRFAAPLRPLTSFASTARTDVAIQRGPGGPRLGRRIDWIRSRGMARITFTRAWDTFTRSVLRRRTTSHTRRGREPMGDALAQDARPAGALQVTRSPTSRSRRLPTPIRLVVSAARLIQTVSASSPAAQRRGTMCCRAQVVRSVAGAPTRTATGAIRPSGPRCQGRR